MELLNSTAHLKRDGRNPTECAKNRARSLTEARSVYCKIRVPGNFFAVSKIDCENSQ
jgi:hypothetical protein